MLKKYIFIIVLSLFAVLTAYSYAEDDLSRLEYQRFGRVYEEDSLGERLNRLETETFGMAQTGDIDGRIDRLSKLNENGKMPSMAVPYNNSLKKKDRLKNFFSNVLDIFDTGSITGFTPSFYSTGGYSDNIYQNEFNNFMNNPQGYCTYHNRPYSDLYRHNLYMNNQPPVTYGNYYGNYPINRNYYPNTYMPPNVYTRAGVHILNN